MTRGVRDDVGPAAAGVRARATDLGSAAAGVRARGTSLLTLGAAGVRTGRWPGG